MCGSKTNIRSFRFSDKVKEILESTGGQTLNAKFENLVLFCYEQIPRRQKDLERLNEEIGRKHEAYLDACKRLQEMRELMKTLEQLQYYGGIACRKAELLAKDLLEDEENPPHKKAV